MFVSQNKGHHKYRAEKWTMWRRFRGNTGVAGKSELSHTLWFGLDTANFSTCHIQSLTEAKLKTVKYSSENRDKSHFYYC